MMMMMMMIYIFHLRGELALHNDRFPHLYRPRKIHVKPWGSEKELRLTERRGDRDRRKMCKMELR
jgi:hypothetical protein